MSIKNTASTSIRKQAVQWLIAQHSGSWSATDQHALEQWLGADSEHQRQYQRMQQLWGNMDAFKSLDFPQRQAAQDYQSPNRSDNLIQFPGLTTSENAVKQAYIQPVAKREYSHWLKTGLAVAATFLLMVVVQTDLQTGTEHYQTGKGEHQTLFLADGSQIVLNTDSELTVELHLFHRNVQLSRGEALFNVTHNPIRPFEVVAGNVKIHDIGTRFNVYNQADKVDVAVLEGEVDIVTDRHRSPDILKAGQAASVSQQGKFSAIPTFNPQAITAWEHGKLVLAEQPLEDVLKQIARYHAVEFQIADPKLRHIKISGTFKTNNLPLLLQTLEAGFPIKAEFIDSQHVRLKKVSRS